MQEQFTFFWHGPFSQWHKSTFMVNGVEYVTAEQFMMAEKARLFNDEDICRQILETNNPKKQKSLGRKVKDFNPQLWDKHKFSIVYLGNYAKFTQNVELKHTLLNTGSTTLVEASPLDKIWGIGLATDDIRASNRNEWKGENILGKVLDAVRARIQCEEYQKEVHCDNPSLF
jgi:ribA/ribD-fused uncharacterized protein